MNFKLFENMKHLSFSIFNLTWAFKTLSNASFGIDQFNPNIWTFFRILTFRVQVEKESSNKFELSLGAPKCIGLLKKKCISYFYWVQLLEFLLRFQLIISDQVVVRFSILKSKMLISSFWVSHGLKPLNFLNNLELTKWLMRVELSKKKIKNIAFKITGF